MVDKKQVLFQVHMYRYIKGTITCHMSADYNDLSCVSWLQTFVMCQLTTNTCHVSAGYNDLSCVSWVQTFVMCQLTTNTCHLSANYNDLSCVSWLQAFVMCQLTTITCHVSVDYNHIDYEAGYSKTTNWYKWAIFRPIKSAVYTVFISCLVH